MWKSVWVVVALAAGCGKDECEKVYDMEQKCRGGKGLAEIDRDVFVLACETARKDDATKEELEATIACAKEDSCEAYETCSKGRRGKARAKEVATQIGANDWKGAWDDCTLNAEYFADATFKAECAKVFTTGAGKLTGDDVERAMFRCKSGDEIKKVSPEFDKACKAMATGQLTTLTAAAKAARDAGKRDFKVCFELERIAESVGGDAVPSAKALCKEVEQADDVREAIEEARANLAAQKRDMPFKCQYAGDKLAELGTEWGKQRLDELHKACYVDLGALILAVDPKDAKYVCPFQVKRVLDKLAKLRDQQFDLAAKHPELAAAITKLPKKCQR